METRTHRPDLHVVQQSRRDKLRVQNIPMSMQYLGDFPGNSEHWSLHNQGLNMDLAQLPSCGYGNISYEPSVLSSEMLNFASNSQALVAHRTDAVSVNQVSTTSPRSDKQVMAGDSALLTNLSQPVSSNFNHFVNVSGDPQNCSTWKSIGSQQICCDWNVTNYSSGSSAGANNSLSPMLVGENSSGSLMPNNVPVSAINVKPSHFRYHESHSSLTNPSSEIPGQYSQNMQLSSSSLYQNSIQEVVTSASIETQEIKMTSLPLESAGGTSHGLWLDSRSELHLLPTYADHSSVLCVKGDSNFVNRRVEGCHQWHGEFEQDLRATGNDISNAQALSLSLSSVSPSKTHLGQIRDRHHVCEDLNCIMDGLPGLRPLRSDYLCSSLKQWSKLLENAACQDMVGNSTLTHRNVVPFGPFTGYATILKSSRFLKPAQQLLDELCNVSGHRAPRISELTEKVLDEVSLSSDAMVNAATCPGGSMAGGSSGLSSFHGSNEKSREVDGVSSSNESYPRSEYQQTSVKLLYIQDEVRRRYRQYHQQMQMVVSSFESVAGLSAATPYILLVLKTISRNFYSLINAISDHLRNMRKTIGEELLSRTGRSKGDRVSSSLKLVDQTLEKQKAIGGSMGFLDPQPQPHVWRPQRGLPERAVAILRAWLFDHFLHPYPTDTDKHVLANQTGLTRNQVSNWFINARVRVWKPMVEEIHMLETKEMAEKGSNVGEAEVITATESATQPNHGQHLNSFTLPNESQYSDRLSMRGMPGVQADCCRGIGSSPYIGERSHPANWSAQGKQSRVNCHLPAGMDGPLMGFMPYQRNNLEIGGLGSVSLTLGLRQSTEGVQQQQQLQQHEPQLRQQLGGQMIHNYFG